MNSGEAIAPHPRNCLLIVLQYQYLALHFYVLSAQGAPILDVKCVCRTVSNDPQLISLHKAIINN